MAWDPQQYGRFAEERDRPFHDLLAQVRSAAPRTVVDLGCGTGRLAATLALRWPGAQVRGLDSSGEMVAAGPAPAGVTLEVAHAEEFSAEGTDVLVSNALLQWVPDHPRLLLEWAHQLPAGGWLAFGVPANFGAPSHVLMRELAAGSRWAAPLAGVLRGTESVLPPEEYVGLLASAGLAVQGWQTTYLHVLGGVDPVLEWVRGTALRPVLAALDEADAAEFTESYATLLRQAYPPQPFGTVLPFTRTFVVAHKA